VSGYGHVDARKSGWMERKFGEKKRAGLKIDVMRMTLTERSRLG